MIDYLQIEWKVGGYCIEPPLDSIYYNHKEDPNLSKRVLGLKFIKIQSRSLIPTKQFCQALKSHIYTKHGYRVKENSFPFTIPFLVVGEQKISLRIKFYNPNILVLSFVTNLINYEISSKEIIQLERFSSNPILTSIAKFCFNVHLGAEAKDAVIADFITIPLVRVSSSIHAIDRREVVNILTRHEYIDERATEEVLEKNITINVDNDHLLLDKQGAVFCLNTDDSQSQKNRYTRISSVFELGLFLKLFSDFILSNAENNFDKTLIEYVKSLNEVFGECVLNESVSAKRGWTLIKLELGLKPINPEDMESKSRGDINWQMWAVLLSLVSLIVIVLIENGN